MSVIPHSLKYAAHHDFLPNSTVWKDMKRNDSTMQRPEKYSLSQMISVNINRINHVDSIYP